MKHPKADLMSGIGYGGTLKDNIDASKLCYYNRLTKYQQRQDTQ